MRLWLFLFALINSLNFAYANDENTTDIVAQHSNRCTRYFSYYETKYNIPNHLLKAVALKESGLYHHGTRKTHPWPWTINYKGKGYFFESKAAAINAVKKIFANGDRSVDVGCMQINLHHHKDAFRSLEHAFDPRSNVEYGAKFLSSNHNKTNNWKSAVAAYHSASWKGYSYSDKVLSIWRSEGKKLANSSKNQVTQALSKKSYARNSESYTSQYEKSQSNKFFITVKNPT